MPADHRYRIENGQPCIDVRLGAIEQLFDNRDPAPFRERDLDPNVVEYLVDGAEDLVAHGPFRVVFWLANCNAKDIEDPYRAHFDYELERLARRRRRQRRTGEIALIIGVTVLIALLSVVQLLEDAGGGVIHAVREGFLILAWVVMWRPVEALIYDWLPLRRERKLMSHLRQASVDVRAGEPAHVTASSQLLP